MDPCRLQLRFWGRDVSRALDRNFLHSCGLHLSIILIVFPLTGGRCSQPVFHRVALPTESAVMERVHTRCSGQSTASNRSPMRRGNKLCSPKRRGNKEISCFFADK